MPVNHFKQFLISKVLSALRLAIRHTNLIVVTTIVVYALHLHLTVR